MQTIIGAGGTIGKPLARELKQYTQAIRLVNRHPQQVNGDDELFSADVTDPDMLDKAIAGSEVVYCTIGFKYELKTWQQTWPSFMKHLTASCLKHGSKLVFFDNVYMYAASSIPDMNETSAVDPPSKKGQVRAEVVSILEEAGRKGLTWIIARSADFYGPENRQSVLVETVLKNQLKGKKAQWLGKIDKVHQYTYTPDAAKAVAMLGNAPDTWNQVWHLPTDQVSMTAREWVSLFAGYTGSKDGIQVAPPWMVSVMGWFMPIMKEIREMMFQNMQHYRFHDEKFMQRFPDFRVTPAAEGVEETVKWFRNHPLEVGG